jgi:hypothetical protein
MVYDGNEVNLIPLQHILTTVSQQAQREKVKYKGHTKTVKCN